MQRSDAIIRQHVIRQFERLGYTLIDGSGEEHGACTATGRQSINEVVLVPELRKALCDLNQGCRDELIEKAIAELTANRSLVSLADANEQIYKLLKDGVKIDISRQMDEQANDQDNHKTLQIIHWEQPAKNTFTLVSRFWVNGQLGRRCLDLVCFVNGLPFVLLEIAESELPHIFERIEGDYKNAIPSLFWYNAFIVVADTFTCKMGSLTARWEDFFQWKRVHDEREKESVKLETLVEGTCEKERLLDIVENFTLFKKGKGTTKLVSRNHQYLGVNKAVASLRAWELERQKRRAMGLLEETGKQHGKLGVFWHTQGSGKSYSMVFFVRKIQRRIGNQYTFLVITDRDDLDDQIFQNFNHTGTIIEDENEVHARSGKHLKLLLGEKHLLLFTLIQKFRSEVPGQDYEKLSDNENIIVIVDEAHRTQYDTLAKNMRDALPYASFIGFTGTPLMDGEEQTRETFGDYVSIYNFRRAINDGVTVPLFYENHTPQIDLVNEHFQEELAALLEDSMLDERQEQRVLDQYTRSENFFTKGERLDEVADDIVRHFMNRGYMGKAMVVSIDKITAVRTYNRVEAAWLRYQEALRERAKQEKDPDERLNLENKIAYMDWVDMAVVVSASDGDTERFEKFSRDTGELVEIASHHQRFKRRDLAEDFKDENHELCIAFVCAMWMTGFDVRCLSTIYLDRPLQGHTLMQTIARANRVFAGKAIGMIIDYAGTMYALKKALAIYAREDSSGYVEGDRPIGDKSDLVQALRDALTKAELFFQELGIDIQELQAKLAAEREKEQQEALLLPTIDRLVAYDEVKMTALLLMNEVEKFYKAILPDATEKEFTAPVRLYRLLKSGINQTMRPKDVSYVMSPVTRLVHESLEVRGREIRIDAETGEPRGSFYLHEIDTGKLNVNLRSGYRRINVEQWRHMLREQILRMMEVNPSRVRLLEKLDRAVDRYNMGCANLAVDPPLAGASEKILRHPASQEEQERLLDTFTDELMGITEEATQEEGRHLREGISEEDLTILDYLTATLTLSEEQRAQVKQIAVKLLTALRPLFALLDWQKNPWLLGRVKVAIDEALEKLPPEVYSLELCDQKREELLVYLKRRYKSNGEAPAVG